MKGMTFLPSLVFNKLFRKVKSRSLRSHIICLVVGIPGSSSFRSYGPIYLSVSVICSVISSVLIRKFTK